MRCAAFLAGVRCRRPQFSHDGSLYALLALIVGAAVFLTAALQRRANSRTQNADGLLIAQASRLLARRDRVNFNTFAIHNAPPTVSDHYRR
ncbi:hypothetical protein [Streptomyces xanthochromogenes]|uniref:Uncharacterized protein n=1 Tax=Streptomyces xanthochromogenes TaxID=67384 RepID=A0ABQ2ZF86_9ACTN|nr:hypothetical protein [Streptomyces xanthochromogenes]GGY13118.1 hypothetical protein GCM10010326_00360 [Streptomyces xanthochromogenes]